MGRFRHPETVLRMPYVSTTRNAQGRETHVRGSAVEVLAGFDPGQTVEPRNPAGQRIVTQPVLYVDFDQPAHPLDQWVVRGDTFEVDGDVARWRNPHNGRTPGAVIKLRKVSG